jgi:hypothetical protein
MLPRLAAIATVSMALLVAACAGRSPATIPQPATIQQPAAIPPTSHAATPVDPPGTPVVGDVDGRPGRPELTMEPLGDGAFKATLVDPAAKAWRLVVSGTGDRSRDRWEITVETGDTGPTISATEVVGGEIVDVMDLSGFTDGTATAGGCHATLQVCLDAQGFSLPSDGDGRFSVRLVLPDAAVPLDVFGATAAWPGEPFVLGTWRETAPFPWGRP